jgi:type 1 fimbria pilin
VAGAGTLTGTRDLTFAATDPGAGVYEAVFSVDGQVVQRSVLDEDGGRCRDVGQTGDGTPAFLYLQPCPASVGADVAFDTTSVSNGVHHLVVSLLDAAGNAAPVLDRMVSFYNPPAPGTPGPLNGTNASTHATLSAHWRRATGSTLTVPYGRGARIVGRLSAPGGAGIAGAQVELQAGSRPAVAMTVRSGRDGSFEIVLPRSISSCRLRVSYRARLGDPAPAASRTLQLRVRAGIALAISPRTASAGSVIAFTGHLRGRPVPSEGKQLVLEARSPGGAWIQFKVVRTDRHGRYRAGYRFRFPGPAVYQFRVVSEPESDYPFAAGSSRVLSVRER